MVTVLGVGFLAGFIDLPASVAILESTRHRSVVVEFRVQSADPSPTVEIVSLIPESRVFETPIVSQVNASNIFIVQIVLNDSLDYETVGLHSVRLALVTAGGRVEQTFHVQVIDVNEPPQCQPLFQLPGAEVQVPEGLPAPLLVYNVLAFDPDENDTLSFSIIGIQPDSAKGQFMIDGGGGVISNQGFDYQNGPQEFLLSLLVRDRQDANCSGTVRIKVLRVFIPPLDFLIQSQDISVLENGGAGDIVASVRANTTAPDVQYTFLQSYPPYKIGREDGIITTAFNLDLESDRSLEQRVLLVRAFSVSEGRRGTATVTVNVLDVNEHAPFCVPSIFVLTVPETTEIGKSLGTVMCGDIDISNHNVLLTLRDNDASLYKFRLQDGQLQVNGTLDYDTARIATNSFQYEATILATDSGAPPLTTVIPVMVTVTPVNEFDPQFVGPFEVAVPEDAQWGSVVGTVKAMDADWRFHALLYSLPGGDALFSINPVGGQLYLKGSLDFEVKEVYSLRVQAVDFDQDVDLTVQRTGAVDITIRVQNLNDNPPVCDPVSYESNIFSTRSAGLPVLTLSCTDRDRDPLTATITNGAAVDRFQMNGLTLSSRNAFSYVPGAVYDRTMFEVTIAVSDGKHTTDVVAYIYVVPWTTTVPTTTTTTTPKPPQVVTVVQEFWDPDRWFVVVLTITGALLLLSLALLIWKILTWTSVCATTDPEASDNLLKNSLDSEEPRKQDAANQNYQSSLDGTTSLPKEDSQKSLMRFDGKAEDPVSGRSYLFDSKTGERRWL
ncbi:cadherin-related family member 4-like [Anguilla rostrata]|uniref:cadherin-related family member 4-like n=1 Tax=Anguilla rostrata TaxID=7938 RepID=UPI0030D216BD